MLELRQKMDKITQEIEELRNKIQEKQKELEELKNSCKHSWTAPKLVHTQHSYDCGQFGGTVVHKYWEKECFLCGTNLRTYNTKLLEVPDFRE